VNPWIWLVPLILAAWLVAGLGLALLIGPVLARNSRGPDCGSEEET
jgi:hypothetical protein